MAGGKRERAVKERKAKASSSNSESNDKSSRQESSATDQKVSPKHLSPPSRWDGNRDPTHGRSGSNVSQSRQGGASREYQISHDNKNLDLGYSFSCLAAGYGVPSDLALKPKESNTTGRDITIALNTFNVAVFPTKAVYQYDVNIYTGKEPAKRAAMKLIWNSQQAVQARGPNWVFDGNKIAYSTQKLNEEKDFSVDLDKEMGRQPKKGKDGKERPDMHNVVIRPAGIVRFDVLNAWLEGRASPDPSAVTEAISFLDHLMRQWPSEKFVTVKRSFYSPQEKRTDLGAGVEVFHGVYSSIRPVYVSPNSSAVLSVNVDTSTTAFWRSIELKNVLIHMFGSGGRDMSIEKVEYQCKPTDSGGESRAFQVLKRLRRVAVHVTHRGETGQSQKQIIDRFINKTAKDHKVQIRNHDTGKEEEKTVEQYFYDRYKIQLRHPRLPLIKTVKGSYLPPEICYIAENQKYPFKLSEGQTREMIKVAVTPPPERWQAVEHGLGMLNWRANPYFKHYGLQVNENCTKVKAKLLPNPKVAFAQGSEGNPVDPKTFGKWDLRNKKFIDPAKPNMLDAWGICWLPGRGEPQEEEVRRFVQNLVKILIGHGIQVAEKNPLVRRGEPDPAESVSQLYLAVGKKYNSEPKLLVVIVPDRDAEVYNRVKRSADCRYGCVSQVLQAAHVKKNQAQYCSNVCMKINAKLGGSTTQAQSTVRPKGWFTKPTMVIGADVSHGAPGSDAASIASLTVSWDRAMVKYAAAVENNGSRVEMITKENIESMLTTLLKQWFNVVGNRNAPQHIIYIRDGVSEGQYPHVMQQEVYNLRHLVKGLFPNVDTKFTVIVASKRHHVRFFPEGRDGDRNGNALPGTLVTTGATTPFEFDFYLCAHTAIKGTARPVHYHVLHDDTKMGVQEIQNWIYECSYQYVRSTTAVSLHPAVYYAHLAAHRATSHYDRKQSDVEKEAKAAAKGQKQTLASSTQQMEEKPLIPFPPRPTQIALTMWYI